MNQSRAGKGVVVTLEILAERYESFKTHLSRRLFREDRPGDIRSAA